MVPSDPFFAKWSLCLEREAGKGKETETDAGTGLISGKRKAGGASAGLAGKLTPLMAFGVLTDSNAHSTNPWESQSPVALESSQFLLLVR